MKVSSSAALWPMSRAAFTLKGPIRLLKLKLSFVRMQFSYIIRLSRPCRVIAGRSRVYSR